ncbi:MAG TPA: Ppx/GppA phosphatase family protein [Egibacteraceae bacterium]|nr:Ppx/GppA phosphatase family protein [Egibacteraceae bacterium]
MKRVAAVDVGTNSVRLLVAEPADGGIAHLERLMTVTRLGQGVDASGRLHPDALRRTLDCVAGYAARWAELGVTRVRIAATSAVRDAANRDAFFDGVRDIAGIDAEVLSGAEEARTAFRGATASLDAPAPFLVLDIGGGSTEFILGTTRPEADTSRQLGCVRLTERCLGGDPPAAAQLDEARAVVDAELDAVEALFEPRAARTLVGVAGTVTTIGALHLELPEYLPERIHGARVPVDGVRAIFERLAEQTSAQRARLGPMAKGREDVIVGGALILLRVMERFGFDEVLVSEADILDGLAMSLLD